MSNVLETLSEKRIPTWRGLVLIVSIVLFTALLFFTAFFLSQTSQVKQIQNSHAATSGTDWYVSKTAQSNGDGTSWSTAWNELSNINWSVIQPGDNINIDGGTSQLVYTTPLIPDKSGSSGAPITIRLSSETGRNGQVVIFGGRTTPLPECDTPINNYVYQTAGVNLAGIDLSIGSPSWITVDGTKWRGIVVYGHNLTGIKLSSGNQNDTFKYMELYDNGQAVRFPLGGPNYDRWRSDEPGILAHGTNITFDHMLIHDNGQDVFQSGGGVNNFTITNSWLYNGRPHSSNPSLAYNYCMHSDGFQVYNGGTQSGITFDHDIIGPGLMQGTILGQTYPAPTPPTVINNVTLRDVLILDTTNANIMGYGTVTETGWNLDHVTSFHVAYDPDGNQHHSIAGQYSNAIVTNSIFSGGQVYLPGTGSYSGNIIYNLTGQPNGFGTNQNPQFTNAPAYTGTQPTLNDYINGNYDFTSPSGVGSRLTSVAQLMGAPQGTPTPVPSGSPTATPVPTNIPSPTPLVPTRTPTPVPPTPTRTPTPIHTPTPIRPSITPTPIESSKWTAQFFNNRTLSGSARTTRQDSAINFNWGTGSPANHITRDNFSVRWTKQVNFVSGNYTFTTYHDDGMRLYIDNNLVYNYWSNQSARSRSFTLFISGGVHTLRTEYYEATGTAIAVLRWR